MPNVLPPGVKWINLLNDTILDAGEAVGKLADLVEAMADDDEPADLEEVVKAGINLRAVLQQGRDAQYALLEYAHHLMPQRQIVLPGIGRVERTGGWERKGWEHEALAAKVVQWAREERRAYAQEHDGELPPETEGQTVARLMLGAAGISYWKVGTAEEHGLNVDEYCKKEPARKSISLPKAEE